MIIVTGGAGFIGSALVWHLNQSGQRNIVIADELGLDQKWQNLAKRQINNFIHKNELFHWLENQKEPVEAVFHLGACSSTTEADGDYLIRNNVHYSMKLFEYCTQKKIPFIYASSAATYGNGEKGYSDDHSKLNLLRPINKYGYSKQLFDVWATQQKAQPPFWAGLKFFNVYGPNEYHKGGQSSVVFAAFPQVRDAQSLKLFKSYNSDYKDGEQLRDFVYVKDVVKVMEHLWKNHQQIKSNIFNLGSGKARTFLDLGRAVFKVMEIPERINWIEMPNNVKNQYQYFTEADLTKLRSVAEYNAPMTTLEDGIKDYLKNHLMHEDPYL